MIYNTQNSSERKSLMIKCNCKGCTKRYIACHDYCEDYKSFKNESQRLKYIEKADRIYWSYVKSKIIRQKLIHD